MPGSVVDLRNSLGTNFIGLLVSSVFLGVSIVQTWTYYLRYGNKDTKALKFFVGFLIVTNTVDTILSAYGIYWYLVLNFGNLEILSYSMWAINVDLLFSAAPNSAVELYYARRVYILTKSLICPVLIMVLVLFGNAVGIYFTAEVFATNKVDTFTTAPWLRFMGMGSVVLADIVIAGMMCWALYRRKTGFARTDSIINTLMVYSMNSGLLASCLGIAGIMSSALAHNSTAPLALTWLLNKCYLNSFLALLNSRESLRRDRSTTGIDNRGNVFNISALRFNRSPESGSKHPGVSVTVHHATASKFVQDKPGHNVGPILEVPKEL